MSMQKNGLYGGIVEGLGSEGEGIIKTEGTTAFVPFCLTGERVIFKALKVKDGIAYGKAEEITEKSPDRAEAPCPLFGKCGGCDIQHMNYPAQLVFKRQMLKNTLAKIGGFKDIEVDETVPCDKPLRYRNKLVLPIGADSNGGIVFGFYARRSHRIIPTDDCLIQAGWMKNAVAAVRKFAAENNLAGYDEISKRGVLRRLAVREIKNKYIIAIVAAKKIDLNPLAGELDGLFGEYTLLLNVNRSDSNVIFSKEWYICRGEGKFEAEEMGIFYGAGAETFVQVNDGVRTKLYGRVISEAAGDVTAVDLYSGGGLLTAMLAKNCRSAYGVEVVKEASACADELCRRNGLENMFNVCGKVEDVLDEILGKACGPKVIVCDPPRKGMDKSVAENLNVCGAEKIILVSCNPATLARDMKILSKNYSVASITPFDMFPQTRHVETLVVMTHKK